MPNKKIIIWDCQQSLQRYGFFSFGRERIEKRRAKFIAFLLRDALVENNEKLAELIIRDQMMLMISGTSCIDPTQIYREYNNHEYLRMARRTNISSRYGAIIKQALERLSGIEDLDEKELNSGVALTHRVWLGKMLPDDKIVSLKASNRVLEQRWQSVDGKNKVTLEHHIWTDRPDLLSRNDEFRNTHIHHIEEVFTQRDVLFRYFQSFLAHNEYSFISDLVRYKICQQYGGLYLGISWNDYETFSHSNISFAPNRNTFKVLTVVKGDFDAMPQAFSRSLNSQMVQYLTLFNEAFRLKLVSLDCVDSDVIYFGRASHPLCNLILKYQEQCLTMLGKKEIPNVLKNYRLKMRVMLPELWQSVDDDNMFKILVREFIHGRRTANMGLITNVFPLEQALMDLGYYDIIDCADDSIGNQIARLKDSCRFHVKYCLGRRAYMVEELNLYRYPSQSWMKIDLGAKKNMEC